MSQSRCKDTTLWPQVKRNGGICLQKRGRQEVSINCKWLVFRLLVWVIVCKNRGCSSGVLRAWGHEVMRSWRSWRWMQSAKGYTFPKEIIIYNIYYIYYILLFIFTYLRIRLKSGQNAYNPKPPSPLLRSSWPAWPHDLMTSWPLYKTGGLQLRGTCNCSFSVLTNQGVDRHEPYPNFRVQFRDCPSDFLANVPLYRLHFYHRNWDGTETEIRFDSV